MNTLTKQFFLGGNATFTVQSGKTGRHFTFRIRQPKNTAPYFVSVMRGTDNENHYTYMGILQPHTGAITPTRKSKVQPNEEAFIVAQWALNKVWNNLPVLGGSSIRHEGKCGCCGRKLTTPESLDRGIGPECWSRLHGK